MKKLFLMLSLLLGLNIASAATVHYLYDCGGGALECIELDVGTYFPNGLTIEGSPYSPGKCPPWPPQNSQSSAQIAGNYKIINGNKMILSNKPAQPNNKRLFTEFKKK